MELGHGDVGVHCALCSAVYLEFPLLEVKLCGFFFFPHLQEACFAHPYLGRTMVIIYHAPHLLASQHLPQFTTMFCYDSFVNLSKAAPPSSWGEGTLSALLTAVSPAPSKRHKVAAQYMSGRCDRCIHKSVHCIHIDVLGKKKGLTTMSSGTRRQGIRAFNLSLKALFYHALFFYPGDISTGREKLEENAPQHE